MTKTTDRIERINVISIIDFLVTNGIRAHNLRLLSSMTHKFPCAVEGFPAATSRLPPNKILLSLCLL